MLSCILPVFPALVDTFLDSFVNLLAVGQCSDIGRRNLKKNCQLYHLLRLHLEKSYVYPFIPRIPIPK